MKKSSCGWTGGGRTPLKSTSRVRRCRSIWKLCDTLELNLCKGDGTEENWSYHLNAAEQEVLARKMEDYCQQQTGMNLHEYAWQLREEQGQASQTQL